MKIKYKVGNIVDATEDVICQGCTTLGPNRSYGVGFDIEKKWPDHYEKAKDKFSHECIDLIPGEVIFTSTWNKIIAHCITQKYFFLTKKRYASYDAIASCFYHVNQMARDRLLSVAMPMIGTGCGGAKWSIISAIIEETFINVEPVVYVLDLRLITGSLK